MLNICRKTFDIFNKEEILYCHWKSNEHLAAGLDGDTDLDILVDRDRFNEVNRILLGAGYIRCKTVSYLDYNAVEDFLGFDEENGRIIHLHLHYELVAGRKFLKEYHLPLEREILNSRVLDEHHDIYTIDPALELILLIIRRALKQTWFDSLTSGKGIFTGGERREYFWLRERIVINRVEELSEELVDQELSQLIRSFLDQDLSKKNTRDQFYRIRKVVDEEFRKYCLYSGTGRLLRYYLQKFLAGWNYLKSRKLNRPSLYRRGLKNGGAIVAFLGVDGAGKSTLLKEINSWLSWKLDIQKIYFGSGEGRSSLLRFPLKLVARVRNRFRGEVVNKEKKEYSQKEKFAGFKFVKFLWAVTLALEKRKKLFKMWRARTRGMVVLCDRFPQTQFYGFNDGPLLREWADSPNNLKRKISDWEYNIYKLSAELSPDIVFKLTVSPEVSAERKKDTPMYMIKEKKKVVDELQFGGGTEVFLIDSSGPLEETALNIKREIWSKLI